MITGAHAILFTRDAEADRGFFRDVLGFPFVDVGHGWLIFALPPSEVAVHPADGDGSHELYLMCADVKAFVGAMAKKGVPTTPLHEERWGILTKITLPSGSVVGVYEPRHASPKHAAVTKRAPSRAAAKKKAAPERARPVAKPKAKKRAK
jgi:catechol 2,3-dioxygenase-like lactoylglutathione lyase family enzyme